MMEVVTLTIQAGTRKVKYRLLDTDIDPAFDLLDAWCNCTREVGDKAFEMMLAEKREIEEAGE